VYIQRPNTNTPTVSERTSSTPYVPVVDLALPRLEAARQIDEACGNVGFFQIVGHRVDPAIDRRAWDLARQFFALPLDAKLAVAIPPGAAYGYGRFEVERLAASLGHDTPPDLKETFSIGPFEIPDSAIDDPTATFVYSTNPWPAALPEMERAFGEHYRALAELAARVMSLMATALALPDDYFEPAIDHHTSALRALHYPDLTNHELQPGQLRAGAHTDYGTLTLLRQDDALGGLEVRDRDGVWHAVEPLTGAYVVNVGDALERWTNDRWRSTLHRVVVPPTDAGRDCERFSVAFFHNANWDAVIECLPGCADEQHPARYVPVSAGKHLMDKFRSTQSSYG